jgi:hypothetical protein
VDYRGVGTYGRRRRTSDPRATRGQLGVGRSYTTRVMKVFKAAHILEVRRGSILVLDHDALIQRSCLCNQAVKQHFDEVLRGIYPPDVA